MMMTSSQFGLDDMEALLWGPSSPMADAMGSALFHSDQEEQPERGRSPGSEGGASLASFSSSPSSLSSPPPFYSPPPSPPALLLHGDKAGTESDLLPLPWLAHPDQLGRTQTVANDSKGDYCLHSYLQSNVCIQKCYSCDCYITDAFFYTSNEHRPLH